MRNIDTLMKKPMPVKWYDWKEKKIFEAANRELELNKDYSRSYNPAKA